MNDQSKPAVARVRRFLTRASFLAALPYMAGGILLILAVVLVGRELEHHLAAIESWIAQLGAWGVLAFIALFVLATSLLVPESVFGFLAGALFGMAWGMAAAFSASLLAGALQFVLARHLLRARIERTLAANPSLLAIQRAVSRDEFRLQVLLRLAPLNPATVSYLLGAAGVRFGGFFVAILALVPHLVFEVYFGQAGKHIARVAGGGLKADRLREFSVVAGAVVGGIVMVVLSKMARKALVRAMADPVVENAASGEGPV